MENTGKSDIKIQQKEFDQFVRAIGLEIEQAQVKLISAANVQMLLHYWKVGHFILYNQKKLGWGSKVIDNISNAIRGKYPEKKGYSPRNLKYMCQFAKLYPLETLQQFLLADKELETPTIEKVVLVTEILNKYEYAQEALSKIQFTDLDENKFGQQVVAQTQIADLEENIIGQQPVAQLQSNYDSEENEIGQEPLAQLQSVDLERNIIGQQPAAQIQTITETLTVMTQQSIAQIENAFICSPVSKTNWASHVILMNTQLSLGVKYWYMKQSVEFGWSSNILKMQIESGLFQRQIEKRKVSNFAATLPQPQSDLANYLLKDPYVFDLAGVRERADERDIEEQLVTHVTKYLLEMGNGFAFVARQKHFQIGDNDYYADLILYNIKLHAYVVIELKATPFKPEYAGQLNFYINVANDKLRGEHDNKTIGLLLCRGKNEIVAQYALSGYNQPIGVSDYQLSKAIPEDLKSALPTIEEVEEELLQLLERNKEG